MRRYKLIVIGGGPAGLAAAIRAKKEGIDEILILERDQEAGGILLQCVHNGFGLHRFKEELTGPEYAERFVDEALSLGIEIQCETMVIEIHPNLILETSSDQHGYELIEAEAIILAMGCRERTGGAILLPGSRPAGVYTAGTAQRYINMEGYMVGKEIVILGSGDIGLIMARRMTLEGAKVHAVVELMPYSGGLTRNIVQCLDDYQIPLYLSHTVTKVMGQSRVEGIRIAQVDSDKQVIEGTDKFFSCDTLLLSVGLIPENELSKGLGLLMDPVTKGPSVDNTMATSMPGVYACGNVVHVHDLVDYVSEESERAGLGAADYLKQTKKPETNLVRTQKGRGIAYIVPQTFNLKEDQGPIDLFFRVTGVYKQASLVIKGNEGILQEVRKKHLVPGEMTRLSLKLDKATLSSLSTLSLEVVGHDESNLY